jgi:hypothetical protein
MSGLSKEQLAEARRVGQDFKQVLTSRPSKSTISYLSSLRNAVRLFERDNGMQGHSELNRWHTFWLGFRYAQLLERRKRRKRRLRRTRKL